MASFDQTLPGLQALSLSFRLELQHPSIPLAKGHWSSHPVYSGIAFEPGPEFAIPNSLQIPIQALLQPTRPRGSYTRPLGPRSVEVMSPP